MEIALKGKHVLVFGLGLLGGGLATTKWLLGKGAIVRVTDRKTKEELRPTLAKLGRHSRLSFRLGGHEEGDIRWADLIVVNPGVPREHAHFALAAKLGKPLMSETALFFAHNRRPVVAVTGTRGKTTVTSWIAALLSTPTKRVLPAGNTPANPLLSEIARRGAAKIPVVAELSSWQLELLPVSGRAPEVAVITNLYPDHLNRYRGIKDYADAKANIFLHQKPADALVVNADHPWTRWFLAKRPKGRIYFTSLRPLSKKSAGMCLIGDSMIFQEDGKRHIVARIDRFRKRFGEHNTMNAVQAALAAHLLNPHLKITERKLLALRTPEFRQEIIAERKRLIVVNDTTATSPDGTIAAIRRFATLGRVILIAGGTDKMLEFSALAKEITERVDPDDLILLGGSATDKLVAALKRQRFMSGSWVTPHNSLHDSVVAALFRSKAKGRVPAVILFSPGAASFEKFANEFDRGAKFNAIARTVILKK